MPITSTEHLGFLASARTVCRGSERKVSIADAAQEMGAYGGMLLRRRACGYWGIRKSVAGCVMTGMPRDRWI